MNQTVQIIKCLCTLILFFIEYCHLNKQELGIPHINVDEVINMTYVEMENSDVEIGGHWMPNDCIPYQKVAVILPHRNRQHEYQTLLKRLHSMLKKQKINYTIFIVTQVKFL